MADATLTAAEARSQLYEIIRRDTDFETKAEAALELGRRYLDADHGFLTQIDQPTNSWEILVSTDPVEGDFHAGLELDLDTAYCKRTIEAEASLAFTDAPKEGWDDDPAFTEGGYHCYHGTKLIVDEEPYGTVCFLSEQPRGEGFTDGETMYAELVAQLLEREIERTEHEAEIRRQANLATVLNRVLRHNLRNDMSVIRGRTQLMADKLGDDENGQIALRKIDELIELAETARELELVIEHAENPREVQLGHLLSHAVDSVAQEYPAAEISVGCEQDLSMVVSDDVELALTELIENAAKHCGDQPVIDIDVEVGDEQVDIHIADNGPGLSDQERLALHEGAETPLVHGSGLGLWLVNWVVTSHDGSVEAAVSPAGTTMTVHLPRHESSGRQPKRSELKRSRDQYRAAFQNAIDAMIITDDEGRIIDANVAATRLLKLNREALLGRSLPEFLPEGFDFEDHWQAFRSDGIDRGTITLVGADGAGTAVDYAGSANIVPGQHLFIARENTEVSASSQ